MLIAFHKPHGVLSQFTPDGSPHRTLAEFGFPKNVYPIGRLDADSEGLLLLGDEAGLNQRLLHPRHAHEREYWAQVELIPAPATLQKLSGGVEIRGHKTLPCRAWILDPQPELRPEFAPSDLVETLNPQTGPFPSGSRPSLEPERPSPIRHIGMARRAGSETGAPFPFLPPRDPPIRFRKNVPTCWIGLELIEGKNRQVRRMTAASGHPTLRLVRVRIGEYWLGDLGPGCWKKLSVTERAAVLS